MTRQEIQQFIDEMKRQGDHEWTPRMVKECFMGYSLGEALEAVNHPLGKKLWEQWLVNKCERVIAWINRRQRGRHQYILLRVPEVDQNNA